MANRPENYRERDKWRQTTQAQKKRYYKKTAIYGKVNWTVQHEKMVLEHEIPDSELSKKIGHSVQAIQTRRSRLTKKLA